MNTRCRRCREEAVTLIEVLVLLVVMAAMTMILLQPVSRPKAKSSRIGCVNNLRNVGLALRVFSTDNGDQLPWQLAGTNGTKELLSGPNLASQHLAFISNRLSSTKLLVCPSDTERSVASSFSNFRPTNLSYFLGLVADERNPQGLLAGDRNLTTNGIDAGPGLLHLGTNMNAGFSVKIHLSAGNVLLADGSVQQVTSGRFQETVVSVAMASTNAINQLLIP